jgi:hypothetical protein
MTDDKIAFSLGQQEGIEIEIPCKVGDILRYDEVKVFFRCQDKKEYLIYKDFAIAALTELTSLLELAIKDELNLDKSMTEDIGYWWNQHLQGKDSLSDSLVNESISSAALRTLLWSAARRSSTWLYNRDGKIFLEITPTYPWHFDNDEAESNKRYILYDEFIKNYKPYVIRELSKKTAQRWLKQAQELIQIIESNDSKYMKQ